MILKNSIDSCNNIHDIQRLAKRKLPAPIYHYLEGGADDEWSLQRNMDAFNDYELIPAQLQDVKHIDTSTKLLGMDLDFPVILSPTGMSRLFHHKKEFAVAAAAKKFNTPYTLSTMGTTSIEEIAELDHPASMFQIYIHKDRGLTSEFVERCKEAGYPALCLTVDTPLLGNRERDKVHGMTMPPRVTLSSLLSFITHTEWTFNLLRYPDFRLANVLNRVDAMGQGSMKLIEYVNSQFDRNVSWDDVTWLVDQWEGPLVIKGLLSPSDANLAMKAGASAIMISNHGGRQLDSVPASVDCIAPIRDLIGDQLELIIDGGIRRGTDALKALALGANAVSIARPYLYGLAAGGQTGVERVLEMFKQEIEQDMALLGVNSIAGLNTSHVQHRFKK